MMTDNKKDTSENVPEIPVTQDGLPLIVNGQKLSETALQALREARDRAHADKNRGALPREINGTKRGVEPTRYGDWEKDGKATDF